ncbi:hypothetical protein BCV71DRAFT_10814, partial [Rhizopus microsporus]
MQKTNFREEHKVAVNASKANKNQDCGSSLLRFVNPSIIRLNETLAQRITEVSNHIPLSHL